MAETRPIQETTNTTTLLPPNTAQYAFPSTNNNNDKTKKRKQRDVVDIHNSAYFKILAIVQQLRPHFIEALQTPDLCNCKAAYEIRKRMELVMDLYKQLQIEGNPITNYENRSACQPLLGEKKLEKEYLDGLNQGCPELFYSKYVPKKLPEKELPLDPVSLGEKFNNDRPQGSYIVGGSAFSWNFITFANRKPPVYYGVTKYSYRHNHSSSEKGNLS